LSAFLDSIMFTRFAPLLLALLTPLSAAAQQYVPVVSAVESQTPLIDGLLSIDRLSSAAGTETPVVPLWASPDGRLLAIVALSHGSGAPTLPPTPSFGGNPDLRVIDATDLFSSGLRWRLGNGVRADLLVGRQVSPISFHNHGLDCGSLTPGCAQDGFASSLQGLLSGSIGLGWTSPSETVDFSFGLSWLGRSAEVAGMSSSSQFDLVISDANGAMPFKLDAAHAVSARASWQFDQHSFLDLTAGISRGQFAPAWYGLAEPALDVSRAALGLGITSGPLRGNIVGHIINIDDPTAFGAKRWSGLDLGVSWRTPWRGELSVGAQNLWSVPLDPGPARDNDAAQARMPYVQYRQDL
jgi:hypothetical protein